MNVSGPSKTIYSVGQPRNCSLRYLHLKRSLYICTIKTMHRGCYCLDFGRACLQHWIHQLCLTDHGSWCWQLAVGSSSWWSLGKWFSCISYWLVWFPFVLLDLVSFVCLGPQVGGSAPWCRSRETLHFSQNLLRTVVHDICCE